MTAVCRCDASGIQEESQPTRKRMDNVKCQECSGPATRDMVSSRTSSRAILVLTLALFTTFCYGVRAAPDAFSRRHKDYDITISPDALQELQQFGLTENMLQDMKQPEEVEAVLKIIQEYQKQQQTDYDINRQDSGNPPAPESYSNPPIPMALPIKFFRPQEAPTREENKRANHYTYACHFKICNIGRRQNYRRSPWIRR